MADEVEIMPPLKRLDKKRAAYAYAYGAFHDAREMRFMRARWVGGSSADDAHNAAPDFSERIMPTKGTLGSTIRRAILGV